MEKLFTFEECPTGWGIRGIFSDDRYYFYDDMLLPNTRENGEPITEVASGAFAETEYVGGIIIPSNYKVVAESSFEACWFLSFVDMSRSSIELIGTGAFDYCDCLKTIEFPDCLKVIGHCAFSHSGLRAAHLPKDLTIIASNCFTNCEHLSCITISPENRYFDSRDNCNAVIDSRTNTLIAGCTTTTIPETVTSLGEYAFMECYISKLVIPDTIQSIGRGCFYSSKIEILYIPSNKRHLLTGTRLPESCEIIEY